VRFTKRSRQVSPGGTPHLPVLQIVDAFGVARSGGLQPVLSECVHGAT
jgi:hypothetical protein